MSRQLFDLIVAETHAVPAELELRDPQHLATVARVADRLLDAGADAASLAQLELDLVQRSEATPLALHLAAKLARGRRTVLDLDHPVHVSLVFAMFKEHTRIVRPDQHPHGEDFLVRKVEQLNWLSAGSKLEWDLVVVDDGCPENSGALAQQILAERLPTEPVRVLFLKEAIEENLPITRPMTSTNDSRKGGSVAYGLWSALQQSRENHIVAFTDADLSTHLGQTGLLVEGIFGQGKDAAIGSRREPTSVVIKKGLRNTRGKLFIYLWKGLIGPLHRVIDTQCGFKAFRAEAAQHAVTDMIEKGFAFDIELLLKTELRRNDSIAKIPIAWIDSDEASTTTDLQPYLPMLKSAAAMYRRYLPADPEADRLAAFLEGMEEEQWARLCEHIPEAIAEADPSTFSAERAVPLEELARALG